MRSNAAASSTLRGGARATGEGTDVADVCASVRATSTSEVVGDLALHHEVLAVWRHDVDDAIELVG